MRRTTVLLSCALLLSTASLPAAMARAETGRQPATQNTAKASRPVIPVAAHPLHRAGSRRAVLAQETRPQPAGSAEDALKAEMEKRWPDAERIYRELLAKEPDRADLW